MTYKKKKINHSKEKNENKSFYNSKKNINLNIDSIQKKNLTLINNNTQIFHTQSVQAPAKERNKNKLLKRVGVKDKIKKKNLVNNLTVQQNYDNLNKNQNSNSSFNSNSLFNQNMFQPQANNNKKIKDDSPDKSCNDRHNKEKKSSISQYIFNEDYRIKDDIESNSNLNDFEMSKNQNIYNNSDNIRKNSNSNFNKSSLNDDLLSNKFSNTNKPQGQEGGQKKKYIFKIKIKDDLIKLIISKGDNINEKVSGFCLENNLDEEDKEQILEAINLKLSDSIKS